MKLKKVLLLTSLIFLVSGCGVNKNNSKTDDPADTDPGIVNPGDGDGGDPGDTTPPDTGPKKIEVPAHTLSDTAPINVNGKGQEISEEEWELFRVYGKANASWYFEGYYNYTYPTNVSNIEKHFTKNGYLQKSGSTITYYERKSGNTFYKYSYSKGEYVREESSLDLPSKYEDTICHEIYVHLHAYKEYEYNSSTGTYTYNLSGNKFEARFHSGYLTYLYAYVSGMEYKIHATFQTTITIPKSYYYE